MTSNNSLNSTCGNFNGVVQENNGNVTNNYIYAENDNSPLESYLDKAKRLCDEGADLMNTDVTKSLKCFHEAIKIYKELPAPHVGIGMIHYRKKDFNLALKSFKDAKKLYENTKFSDPLEQKMLEKFIDKAENMKSRPPFLRW
jgi:tetratricopeptide (TPR) repeat protein